MAKLTKNELERAIAAIPNRTCSICKDGRRKVIAWASINYGGVSFRGPVCEPCFGDKKKEADQGEN